MCRRLVQRLSLLLELRCADTCNLRLRLAQRCNLLPQLHCSQSCSTCNDVQHAVAGTAFAELHHEHTVVACSHSYDVQTTSTETQPDGKVTMCRYLQPAVATCTEVQCILLLHLRCSQSCSTCNDVQHAAAGTAFAELHHDEHTVVACSYDVQTTRTQMQPATAVRTSSYLHPAGAVAM